MTEHVCRLALAHHTLHTLRQQRHIRLVVHILSQQAVHLARLLKVTEHVCKAAPAHHILPVHHTLRQRRHIRLVTHILSLLVARPARRLNLMALVCKAAPALHTRQVRHILHQQHLTLVHHILVQPLHIARHLRLSAL